jgi:uncharacterized protein (TIGR00251 family)
LRVDSAAKWLVCGEGFVTIQVVARPGSSRRGIMRHDPDGLVIALNSPPEKGKANGELIDLFARALRVPRSTVTIVRGQHGRRKTVLIASPDPAALAAKISGLAATLI